MKLIKPVNISPKTVVEILRPRFGCIGNESLVPPKTWGSLMISALDAVRSHITSWKETSEELIIFGHDLNMFGSLEDNNDALQASIVQFSRHLERTLTDVNLIVRIVCVRLSSGLSTRSRHYERIPGVFRNISVLLGPSHQSRVSLECIENNKMHVDFELKNILTRSTPPFMQNYVYLQWNAVVPIYLYCSRGAPLRHVMLCMVVWQH